MVCILKSGLTISVTREILTVTARPSIYRAWVCFHNNINTFLNCSFSCSHLIYKNPRIKEKTAVPCHSKQEKEQYALLRLRVYIKTAIQDPSTIFFFPFPTNPLADLGISISMPQFRFGAFEGSLLEAGDLVEVGVRCDVGVLVAGGVLLGGVALLDGGVARVLLRSFEDSLPLPWGRWWKIRLYLDSGDVATERGVADVCAFDCDFGMGTAVGFLLLGLGVRESWENSPGVFGCEEEPNRERAHLEVSPSTAVA